MSKLKKKKFGPPKKVEILYLEILYFKKKFDFGLFMQLMGIKTKICNTSEKKCYQKNFTAQKSLRKSFYSILGDQKNF